MTYSKVFNKEVCIITISVNIKSCFINTFINSLVKVNYSGRLIIFTNNNISVKSKGMIKINVIKISIIWPFFNYKSDIHHILNQCMLPNNIHNYRWAIYRYSIFYCYMIVRYSYFSNVFLVDIRDSIFQLNPMYIEIHNCIYMCEDASFPFKIKDEKWNSMWIKPFYNYNTSIYNKTPINGGTIYGKSFIILRYLKLFIKYMEKYYSVTSDQGVINFLYYSNLLNNISVCINHNNNGSIYNMGIDLQLNRSCYYIKDNIIHRKDKSVPYIIHQYDRDDNLKKYIFKKYKNNFI